MYMREMNENDALSFYQLNEDDEVMKYTGDARFESPEASAQFLKKYPDITYLKCGYGRWTCVSKDGQSILGWSGIRLQDDGLTDLGYRLNAKVWNQGYGTESSFAALKIAFEIYGLNSVYARANHKNKGSIRVMQKVGMKFLKSENEDHFYLINKQDFVCPIEIAIHLQ